MAIEELPKLWRAEAEMLNEKAAKQDIHSVSSLYEGMSDAYRECAAQLERKLKEQNAN